MLLLQDCGANLCLTLDDLAPGWRIRPGQHYQVGFVGLSWACYVVGTWMGSTAGILKGWMVFGLVRWFIVSWKW